MLRLFVTLTLCLVPLSGHAAVVISEIAWMGTEAAATDEWIELRNTGSAVDVTGWQLSDGGDFMVDLQGTIPASAYAVLERTDDTSAPGTAFLVYTGALSNSGATLTLTDADGAVVDQVAGGEDWQEVGGDNDSKATAQLTTSGWITAAPTPGMVNATIDTSSTDTSGDSEADDEPTEQAEEGDSTDDGDETEASSAGSGQSTYALHLVPREPAVTVSVPKRAYVNQAVTLSADSTGLAEALLDSLSYQWNFGDLHTARGEEVTHRYQYPGNYVVTVIARYKDYEATARSTITVLPTTLSLSRTKTGDLQLHNDAKYELDISGYQVAGVTLPPQTIILPGATITIPAHQQADLALVHDDTGRLIAGRESVPAAVLATAQGREPVSVPSTMATAPAQSALAATTPDPAVTMNTDAFQFATAPAKRPGAAASTTARPTTTVASSAIRSATGTSASDALGNDWPLYALISLLALATFGVYTRYL